MNAETPRKMKGSLVERAAAIYGLDALSTRPVDAPEPIPQNRALVPEPKSHAVVRKTNRSGTIDRKLLTDQGMIVPGAPVSILAEEFRMVKRALLQTAKKVEKSKANAARMILVCSAQPNEGKTFCAINLALSMAAEKDVEVLLVDADFAKPDVVLRMGLQDGPGLLDALADPAIDLEGCVIATDVPHLSVLPSGAKNNSDTELLASERTTAVLAGLLAVDPKRVIIFDSPPVLAASPASVLALHAGQAMLVVRADKTGDTDIREAVALLDACEHIQLVLNSVAFASGGTRFGSYYGPEEAK
ncbi:hypothetical protein BH09PSE4_BH09PSE4_17510 [soil metagenome]